MISRRTLLLFGWVLPVGWYAGRIQAHGLAQGLGQFATPSVPCGDVKPTPAAPDAATFKAGAPLKSSLVEAGMTGERVVLTGTVSGVVCGAIKGARVDFWQADPHGAYDMKTFHLRGHVLTDAQGVYRIETVMPAGYGRRARHLNARVTAAGKPTLDTQVFVADDPMNLKDAAFKPELAVKLSRTTTGWTGIFAFVLNA